MFTLSDFLPSFGGGSTSAPASSTSSNDGSFTRGLFDGLSQLAAPAAGVFTAITNADAQKAATRAQQQIAAQQLAAAQASSSWTKYIPLALGAVVVLGVVAFILKRK
jgi:hypothetical protein